MDSQQMIFISLSAANLRCRLLPLLSRKVVVDEIVLDSPRISIVRYTDGTFNFSDLLKKEKPSEAGAEKTPLSFAVARFSVSSGRVVYNVQFEYQSGWAELSTVARTRLEPKPYWTGHESQLRYQTVFFSAPDAVKGTSFLNVWAYDQSTMPELYGYLPTFRRIRQFPTDQRFEPLIPGSTLYLSDAWAAGRATGSRPERSPRPSTPSTSTRPPASGATRG